MKAQGIVIGYHGCSRTLANRVLKDHESLRPGPHPWDWLGTGIYFWEGSVERALDWSPAYRSVARDDWTAVGAVIDLGNCLDLYDRNCTADVQKAYNELAALYRSSGRELPQNQEGGPGDSQRSKRLLDCLVLNFVHVVNKQEGGQPYDTVRCGFSEGQELYPGAMLFDQTHIQICVRNPQCILGYFKPVGITL